MNLGLNKVVTVNSDIHKKTFSFKEIRAAGYHECSARTGKVYRFFQRHFFSFFVHLSFIVFALGINIFFSFQGLESVSEEAILASEAGKQERRKQKGNVRNKMPLKTNSVYAFVT